MTGWLLRTIVIVALWQLFEGYGSGANAGTIPPVHQPEICAARDLVDVAVPDLAIDIDGHLAIGDLRSFVESQHPTHLGGSEINRATWTKDRTSVALLYPVELGVGILGRKDRNNSLNVEGWSQPIVSQRNPRFYRPFLGQVSNFGGFHQYVGPLAINFGFGRSGGLSLPFPHDLLQIDGKSKSQDHCTEEAYPNRNAFASGPVPDGYGRTQNERPEGGKPSDRKIEHSVPFHDAITLAISGVLVGLAFGLMLGLFLATKRPIPRGGPL